MENTTDTIKDLYSSEHLKNFLEHFNHHVVSYLQRCQEPATAITSQFSFEDIKKVTDQILKGVLPDMDTYTACFNEISAIIMEYGHRLQSPHYMGHQVPPPLPLASLFCGYVGLQNQGLAVQEMGPLAYAAERTMVNYFAKKIGYGFDCDGIVTSGGTLANLTAILAARNKAFPKYWTEGFGSSQAILIASADSHYSITRAAGILGIGSKNVLAVEVDQNRKMQPQKLRDLLQEVKAKRLTAFCIVANACSTSTGSFDPLEDIAAIANQNNIWLHVDGAHGASLLISDKYTHLLRGIEHADSVSWDAHKMLHVPSLSSFLFFKRKCDSFLAFDQDAPYLFENKQKMLITDEAVRTFECTKDAKMIILWGVWSIYGEQVFKKIIESLIETTQQFYQYLKEQPDFVPYGQPECNILCFQYKPNGLSLSGVQEISQLQIMTRKRILESKQYYITTTKVDSQVYLRVVVINPLTTIEHLMDLCKLIRQFNQ